MRPRLPLAFCLLLALSAVSPAEEEVSCPPHLDGLATLTDAIRNVGHAVGPEPIPVPVAAVLGTGAEFIANGHYSKVWGNRDWVVKVVMAVDRGGHVMTDAEREAEVDQQLWAAELFTSEPSFRAWARVIPEVFSPGPFVIVQRRGRGEHQSTLAGDAASRAEAERRELESAATGLIPPPGPDPHAGNVSFLEDGGLELWFDQIGNFWIPSTGRALVEARVVALGAVPTSEVFPLGPSYAKRAGDLLVVANLRTRGAFTVQGVLRVLYESAETPLSPGKPLFRALGMPTDDEHAEGNPAASVQHFDHGFMVRKAGEPARVFLTWPERKSWEAAGFQPPPRKTFAEFYGEESARLARMGGYNGGAAGTDPGGHAGWAAAVGSKAAYPELVRKFRVQVARLAGNREALARWYADFAVAILPTNAPIGPGRMTSDWSAHYNWARGAPLAQVETEFLERVRIVSSTLDPTLP